MDRPGAPPQKDSWGGPGRAWHRHRDHVPRPSGGDTCESGPPSRSLGSPGVSPGTQRVPPRTGRWENTSRLSAGAGAGAGAENLDQKQPINWSPSSSTTATGPQGRTLTLYTYTSSPMWTRGLASKSLQKENRRPQPTKEGRARSGSIKIQTTRFSKTTLRKRRKQSR